MFKSMIWALFCLLIAACQETAIIAKTAADPLEPRPEITEYMREPAILVFSKTAGWRHNEGIAGADLFFVELAEEAGYGVFTTANAAVFNAENLARFEIVVFNNVTGPALNPEQQAAFETWMQANGAWIGLHGTGDASLQPWDWYQKTLIGTQFIGHTMDPPIQEARLVRLTQDHPVTAGLPDSWSHTDEWYSFSSVPSQDGVTPLIGLDESSYAPVNTVVQRWPEDLRMGPEPADHPMIWAVCREGFRGVYSALGHSHQTYNDPVYRRLLKNAFAWVTEESDRGC